MDLEVSDHESVDSSSSDDGSEEDGEVEGGVTEHNDQVVTVEDAAPEEGLEVTPHDTSPPVEGDEGDESDGEMASAVASASQQASKFLEDSDSEEEEMAQANTSEADLQKVFGDDSDGENASMHKRRHSSEGEGEEGGDEAPPKRSRIEESDGEEEEETVGGGNDGGEQGDEVAGKGEGEGEQGVNEAPVVSDSGGESEEEEGEGSSRKEEEVGSVDGDSRGSEEPLAVDVGEREGGVMLQEEVAGYEEDGGEEREEEGRRGGDFGSDDDDDDRRLGDGMTDWDIMMARRKEAMARSRRKKRRDGDLTGNDDHIVAMIKRMREAAQEDRTLNIARKAATKKIQLLPTVMGYLKKADLQTTLIECDILTALAEWLTPLPDHSLPHLKIRESILDTLKAYPIPDSSILKSSKIGKAVMLLYRHPKEAKRNKEKAGKIINDWARPIFGLASDFKSMTRDEREERDYANLSQEARHRISTGERRTSQDDDTEQPQKPGDKGWIGRARVPMPSTRGYVVRPKWNTEQEFHKKSFGKKPLDRYEKHLRKRKQEKMQSKTTHAVPISVEGRHMPL